VPRHSRVRYNGMVTSDAPALLQPQGIPCAAARPRRRHAGATIATLAVVAALTGLNLVFHVLHRSPLWAGPAAAAALLGFARLTGLSWTQLGLGRVHLRSGVRWAAAAIGAVSAVYLTGLALPWTRTAFLDARYHFGISGALLSAFVIIPLGTIVVEEVAFRSVLWGMLARHSPAWWVLLSTSLLFGLWHVIPALHAAAANQALKQAVVQAGPAAGVVVVGGTFVVTALGGVVAGELRRRSGSLLASMGMHWATNGLGVLFGLLAWHLAS
jgi:membrane protease YdiL (CAAX protease family)